MASDNTSIPSTSLVKHPDILMSVGVVGILMVMLVPLPRFFLDLLLSFNITLSIIILLVGMQVRRPLEFSVFPSILLMVTLLRLALNIASDEVAEKTARQWAEYHGFAVKHLAAIRAILDAQEPEYRD